MKYLHNLSIFWSPTNSKPERAHPTPSIMIPAHVVNHVFLFPATRPVMFLWLFKTGCSEMSIVDIAYLYKWEISSPTPRTVIPSMLMIQTKWSRLVLPIWDKWESCVQNTTCPKLSPSAPFCIPPRIVFGSSACRSCHFVVADAFSWWEW